MTLCISGHLERARHQMKFKTVIFARVQAEKDVFSSHISFPALESVSRDKT